MSIVAIVGLRISSQRNSMALYALVRHTPACQRARYFRRGRRERVAFYDYELKLALHFTAISSPGCSYYREADALIFIHQ